jgi:hypothetical protein
VVGAILGVVVAFALLFPKPDTTEVPTLRLTPSSSRESIQMTWPSWWVAIRSNDKMANRKHSRLTISALILGGLVGCGASINESSLQFAKSTCYNLGYTTAQIDTVLIGIRAMRNDGFSQTDVLNILSGPVNCGSFDCWATTGCQEACTQCGFALVHAVYGN